MRLAVVFGVAACLAGCGQNDGSRADRHAGPAASAAPIAVRLARADAEHGATVFRRCAACHNLGPAGTDVDGPNLYGVVGGPVAVRRPRFAYTAALQQVGGVWTPDRLDTWLTNPRSFAPGTSMAFAGISDPQDRADVIAYLAR